MSDRDLAAEAEALLFVEGGTLARTKLASLLGCSATELAATLGALRTQLEGRGLALIETDSEVSLAVAKKQSERVKEILKRELEREIGDAGLEVLGIVLYRGPSTRAQIDYIRGVNTSSTLRNLLARGLLERVGNPDDAREYLYRPTALLLAHLGISARQELPEYGSITAELASFESASGSFTEENAGRDT